MDNVHLPVTTVAQGPGGVNLSVMFGTLESSQGHLSVSMPPQPPFLRSYQTPAQFSFLFTSLLSSGNSFAFLEIEKFCVLHGFMGHFVYAPNLLTCSELRLLERRSKKDT